MIRQIAMIFAAMLALATGARAATDEERAAIAWQNAEAVVAEFAYVQDEATLSKRYRDIERVWQDLGRYHQDVSVFVQKFSLIRARAATAAGDKRRLVTLWQDAIAANQTTTPSMIMSLNVEAAHAVATAGAYDVSAQYFAVARAYAFIRGDQQENTRLQLRVQELQLLAANMNWRDLNDALRDLRDYSQSFPMWTLPRLEALLSEAEIRVAVQPESKQKREELSELKAQIVLLQKGINRDMTATFTSRIRTLFYALEDNYKL